MKLLPLWASFSFLSRLAPPRMFSEQDMASSMFWAPVVGLVLGLIALLPPLAGLAPHVPELRALMWIAVMAWTTRALHWDGLADCMDAWGSGARGEQFQRILKDSRCGSFGVLALVLTLLLQELSLSRMFSGSFPSAWWPALLAPAWGRANMLLLPALLPPHPVSTLGRLMAPGCTLSRAVSWFAVLFVPMLLLMGARASLITLLLSFAIQLFLYRLARRENGFNGDFLGTSCILCESSLLIAPLL
ncbi:MAG TPA: adenosylcobinamide-GDP ribazoletransferase [Candidatus Mailhella merdavium]|nr:adenosylcobinamide-GDP ribazoletransferase [Candidatus Mailhella merdavium]